MDQMWPIFRRIVAIPRDLRRTQLAYAEAAGYYRQAVEVVEPIPTASVQLAEYLNACGLTAYEVGEYPAAEPLYQQALGIREQALGPTHPAVAESLNNLAALYVAHGRDAEAEPLFQRAQAIREQALGTTHPDVEVVRQNYLALLRATERHEEAKQLETRARTRQARLPRAGSA